MKTEWISLFYGGQLPECIMDFDTITGGLVTGKILPTAPHLQSFISHNHPHAVN